MIKSKNKYGQIRTAITNAAREAQEEIADKMVEYAQEEVPVLTGALKASIRKRRATAFRVYAVAEAPYAVFVNSGTRFMTGNPFWDRAVERVKPEIAKTTANVVRERLNRVR